MRRKQLVIAGMLITLALASCNRAPHTGKTNLDTKLDSLSYAIGFFEANNWKKNFEKLPFDTVDYEKIALAFKDSKMVDSYIKFRKNQFDTIDIDMVKKGFFNELAYDQSYFTEMTADIYIRGVLKDVKAKKDSLKKVEGQENLKKGNAFLKENAKKEGVVSLDNGLQYKILEEGNGAKPEKNDRIRCMYEGRLIDGTVFDSTMEREDTATLRLTNMIKGWQQTLPKMPEGSKWRLFIPPSHAYGPNGAGDKIGPNETIIFDVKLIEVLGKDSES